MDKDRLIEIIHLYGNLIPKDSKIDNIKLASLINANYSLSNPITNKAYEEVSKARDLSFRRKLDGSVSVLKV